MATVDQQHFLSRVRQALGRSATVRRQWSELMPSQDMDRQQELVKHITDRSRAKRLELLDTLERRCRQSNIGIHIGQQPDETVRQIAALVQRQCGGGKNNGEVVLWQHPLLQGLRLIRRLPEEGVTAAVNPVDVNRSAHEPSVEQRHRDRFRSQVVSADIGITSADYCLADSATLVMTTRPGRPRLVSLIPPVHIAVISLQQILFDLQELYAMVREPPRKAGAAITNCMTFVSGPSTTRDIEAIPVPGAQGPRELHIVVIAGKAGNDPWKSQARQPYGR